MILYIILAAGSSSRLGYPKQLLSKEGKYLLNHQMEKGREAGFERIVTILGAHADYIINQCGLDTESYLINAAYKNGMGSSIAKAATYAYKLKAQGMVLILADQYAVEIEDLKALKKVIGEDPLAVIFSTDNHQHLGPPSYFPRSLFGVLMSLNEDEGMKSYRNEFKKITKKVVMTNAGLDIDNQCDILDANWVIDVEVQNFFTNH